MAKISNGQTYLGEHLTKNDYYNENEKIHGEWVGRLADEMGLKNNLISAGDEVFENFRKNLSADGQESLTQRTNDERKTTKKDALKALRLSEKYRDGGHPMDAEIASWIKEHPTTSNRVAFFDFQCSAQKSVSIMGITFGDDRLLEAHEEACKAAFGELEKFAARQIGNRQITNTGKLVAGKFTHTSSRTLDAQLHSHFVIANVTQDEEGKRWALSELEMCRAVRYAGKFYQNSMALAAQRLGYNIEIQRDEKGQITGWEIAGVDLALRERQSSRSLAIESSARVFEEKHGRPPTAAERRILTLESRSEKMLESSREKNQSGQKGKYSREEIEKFESIKAAALDRQTPFGEISDEKAREAVEYAREHLFERNSVMSAHEIMAEALNKGMGEVSPDAIKRALDEDKEFARLTDEEGSSKLTTWTNLRLESAAVENCISRKDTEVAFSSIKPVADLSEWTTANKGFNLSDEQKNAVLHTLESKDGIFAIRGVAGAGKTTMLQEVHAQLSERGQEMIYLAPTGSAVDTLRKEGFENAMTIAKYLITLKRDPEEFRGKMLFVDEAGLQSMKTGHDVQMMASHLDQRICFVGDTRQHTSVDAGDYLRVLEEHAQISSGELTSITRQRPPEYRAAISAFAAGDYKLGWDCLENMKAIHEGQSGYLISAVSDYLEKAKGGSDLDKVLCVAPTHAELETLNSGIRQGLQSSGHLKREEKEFQSFRSDGRTNAQKRNPETYAVGDVLIYQGGGRAVVSEISGGQLTFEDGQTMNLKRAAVTRFDVGKLVTIGITENDKILIRANEKTAKLINGQILTVESVTENGEIKTREGKTIPSGFVNFQHGYAVTSHASQGKTVSHVIVAAVKMEAKALYVSTSRGRESVALHLADKEFMGSALRESSRTAALDVQAAQGRIYQQLKKTRHLQPQNFDDIKKGRTKTKTRDLEKSRVSKPQERKK